MQRYRLEVVVGPYYCLQYMCHDDEAHIILAAREVLLTERDVLRARPGLRRRVNVLIGVERFPGSDVWRDIGTWRIDGLSDDALPCYLPAPPVPDLRTRMNRCS